MHQVWCNPRLYEGHNDVGKYIGGTYRRVGVSWGNYKGAWFAFALLAIVASIVIAYTPPFGKTIEKTRIPAKGL